MLSKDDCSKQRLGWESEAGPAIGRLFVKSNPNAGRSTATGKKPSRDARPISSFRISRAAPGDPCSWFGRACGAAFDRDGRGERYSADHDENVSARRLVQPQRRFDLTRSRLGADRKGFCPFVEHLGDDPRRRGSIGSLDGCGLGLSGGMLSARVGSEPARTRHRAGSAIPRRTYRQTGAGFRR